MKGDRGTEREGERESGIERDSRRERGTAREGETESEIERDSRREREGEQGE
jgi:hypothetical protein